MPFQPAIGVSDFRELRSAGAGYVDKTAFILELLEDPTEVVVFNRPHGFGRTLNLSTLRCFLERTPEDLSRLFEGLAVWDAGPARDHFQRYPVLSLSFKDATAATYETAFDAVRRELTRLHERNREVLTSGALSPREAREFEAMLRGEAPEEQCCDALRTLSEQVSHCSEAPVVILIDDHDALLAQGFLHGYLDEITTLLRRLFTASLRDNAALLKGVVASVLRVWRESLSVGLNNIEAHSVLSAEYATSFGFTEAEVERLIEAGEDGSLLSALRAWYGGHQIGGQARYSPRSIARHLAAGAPARFRDDERSAGVLRDALGRASPTLTRDLSVLLGGGAVETRIDENVSLRDLDQRPSAVWSYLLLAGYLTPETVKSARDVVEGALRVPNAEEMQALNALVQAARG